MPAASNSLPVDVHDMSLMTCCLLHAAAPEVLLGERCTPAADLWSFGVVLW